MHQAQKNLRVRKPETPEALAARQAARKARQEAAGFTRCTVWARPEHHPAIKALAELLKDAPTEAPPQPLA